LPGWLVSVQVCGVLVFVALLRAVNVGGAGKLPLSQLKAMCESAGFEAGPARNMNTVANLAEISASLLYGYGKRSGYD
jgi:uncharacterized protein (DUF1697 family)